MADFNLRFVLSVIGVDNVEKAVAGAGAAAQKTGSDLNAVGEAGKRAASGADAVGNAAGRAAQGLNRGAQAATNLKDELKRAGDEGAQAMGGMLGMLDKLEARLGRVSEAGKRFSEINGRLSQLGMAGAAVAGVGGGLLYGAGKMVGSAAEMELQETTIAAVTHSKERGREVYQYADERSVRSVYDLEELVNAAKTLETRGLQTEKYLQAVDDLAATNMDTGATPAEVARALGRLKAGDYGQAFDRLRDFGISRKDLEGQGLKFDKGGSYTDISAEGAQKAVDAVVAIVEEKFNGLSGKLATGTFQGAVSNFGDAIGRLQRTAGEQLLPIATAIVNIATDISSVVVSFTEAHPALAKFVAWFAVLGGAVIVALGIGMMFLAFLGKTYLGYLALTGALGANTAATTANTAAKGANTEAEATNAAVTATSAATIARSALMASAAMGVLALELAALFYVAKMYYDENQRATQTVSDERSGAEKELDSRNAAAVKNTVKQALSDPTISTRDRMKVLGDASKKLSDLGDTEGAQEMINKRNELKATAAGRKAVAENERSGQKFSGSTATQSYLDTINNTQTHVETMRSEDSKFAAQSEEQRKKNAAEAQANSVRELAEQARAQTTAPPMPATPGGTAGVDYNVSNRLDDLPGQRTRIHFDPIDLTEPPVQRQSRHYTNNRPA